MPNYEYRCLECKKPFEIHLAYSEYGKKNVICPHCQSPRVQRRIARVRVARSDQAHLEQMADPSRLASLEDNPQELGRMMRQMSGQVGEDMGPEFHEVVNRLEAGQSPEEIERSLPDLDSGSGTD